jgi:hypothetical protein
MLVASLVGLLLVASGLLWGGSREAAQEAQLEAAIHREIVLGDLRGAMAEYRALLAQADVSRPVAARAWLQIGGCMEKLGQGKEAYSTYRKVVSEYRDQAATAGLANQRLDAWVGPLNLMFADGVPGRVPPGWKEANDMAELRRKDCRSHVGCATVVAPLNVPEPEAGNLMQSFKAVAYRSKTVRLSAWLKLERFVVRPTGILHFPTDEDRGLLWMRVVRANRLVADQKSLPVRTSDWTPVQITADIDFDAQMINLGVMSYGEGRVWIDDISFEVVDK